jgi:hypothetical protein
LSEIFVEFNYKTPSGPAILPGTALADNYNKFSKSSSESPACLSMFLSVPGGIILLP